MKKILIIVAIALVALIVLSSAKDAIIKISVEKGVELVTGLKLRVKSFRVGLVNTLVGIKDLKIYNPRGYPDKIMLDMPEIYVNYDLPAIFKGKIHLEEVRIDMKEFMVVKNKDGELNLDSLKVVEAQKEGKKPAQKAAGVAPQIQIDNLRLRIGKVIYKDYSQGAKPSVKEYDVNIDEEYKNIKDPYSLVSLIVVKALMNTTIANLTNFDLSGLEGTVSESLKTAQKAVEEVAGTAKETLKATSEQAQEAAKETQETLKKTTESLVEAIKLPFGSKK